MNRDALLQERNRLLAQYIKARRDERGRILARLVVIDEELEGERNERVGSAQNRN